MTTVVQQPQQGAVTTVVVTEKQPNACRQAIPALHIAAAVPCLILNIFLPGIGTIVAGFSVFCCGNPGQEGAGKVGTCCLNIFVGLLQLLTCWIFLIGWIWSIMWGIAFLGLSADYHSPQQNTTIITSTPAAQPMVVTQYPQSGNQGAPPPGYTQQPQGMPMEEKTVTQPGEVPYENGQ
ncbi:protein SPEC3-like [Asterias rubens]|uniref:protein SPEC3-like n=1 Tax=Asterias rubens TaxID=7604 RepID=UPI0014556268|nr:protein SPEC3-like [Asterias rubens]